MTMPGLDPLRPAALVTGAAGFLGTRLMTALRSRGWTVAGVDLTAVQGHRVQVADIRDGQALLHVMPTRVDIVIHMAAMLSSDCERRPTAAFDVNVAGTAALLSTLAKTFQPALLMTSSIAVFSGERASDDSPPRPRSTYGTTKAMAELLVADATRRGEVRGCVARLPTVAVRPGPAGGAASAFASTMVKDALAGRDIVVPLAAGRQIALTAPETAVANLCRLAESMVYGPNAPAVVNVPGIVADIDDMADQCRAAAPVMAKVRRVVDPRVDDIVGTWPSRWDCPTAVGLGLRGDQSFAAILASHQHA